MNNDNFPPAHACPEYIQTSAPFYGTLATNCSLDDVRSGKRKKYILLLKNELV
jgi:hypothetical protein